MFGVLLNVGSGCNDPNGRGRVFHDGSFEYLPIPEGYWEKGNGNSPRWICDTIVKAPTYRELGFDYVRFPDLPVHLDPEFGTYTYGHMRRGFGDLKCLLRLNEGGFLFFYENLQNEKGWSPYIIGFFSEPTVHDCRRISESQIHELGSDGFANNAHMRRRHPFATLLIKGGRGSKLLERAFSIAGPTNPLSLRKQVRKILCTPSGKEIRPGSPWFRWTMICEDPEELLAILSR